jgi:hypothetical protein
MRTIEGEVVIVATTPDATEGADIVGTVCIGDPGQMLPTALEMRAAVEIPIACQPKGFTQRADTEEIGISLPALWTLCPRTGWRNSRCAPEPKG